MQLRIGWSPASAWLVRHTLRVRKLLISVALSLIVAAGAGAAFGGEAGKRSASLRLAGGTPVKLRGAGFVSGERVRIRVVSGARSKTRTAYANSAGRFVASFPTIPFDRCNGFAAEAVGSRGSAARLKLPMPLCPPTL